MQKICTVVGTELESMIVLDFLMQVDSLAASFWYTFALIITTYKTLNDLVFSDTFQTIGLVPIIITKISS
jgi:hypothetical protein